MDQQNQQPELAPNMAGVLNPSGLKKLFSQPLLPIILLALSLISLLFSSLFILGSFVMKAANEDAKEKFTASTTATVLQGAQERIERECSSSNSSSSSRRSCRDVIYCEFSYSYSPMADGEYSGSGDVQGSCADAAPVGSERPVYYDPESPTDSVLVDPNSALSQSGWLILLAFGVIPGIFGLAMLIGGIVWLRRTLRKKTSLPVA